MEVLDFRTMDQNQAVHSQVQRRHRKSLDDNPRIVELQLFPCPKDSTMLVDSARRKTYERLALVATTFGDTLRTFTIATLCGFANTPDAKWPTTGKQPTRTIFGLPMADRT